MRRTTLAWLREDPARLRDLIARRLARGFLGRIARHAVRGYPFIYGEASRVSVGDGVVLNDTFMNCASGRITIAEHAFFGSGVSLLTGTHDYHRLGEARHRAVPEHGRDIEIGEGAWVASNATVLGPCRIGEHAVVAAGAVVTGDVAPYAIVGGIPARELGYVEGT